MGQGFSRQRHAGRGAIEYEMLLQKVGVVRNGQKPFAEQIIIIIRYLAKLLQEFFIAIKRL